MRLPKYISELVRGVTETFLDAAGISEVSEVADQATCIATQPLISTARMA
jgi:hypothetical protein